MELEEKTAIITGCGRGIGKATAELFAKNGANLWLHASVQTEEFEDFCSELSEGNNIAVKPVYFDLSDQEEVKNGVKQIIMDKTPIDILVNNAGVAYSGTIFTTPMNQLQDVFSVNYFAPIYLIQLIGKQMIRKKQGNIINVGSVGGLEHQPGYLAYGSSKAALMWATQSISKELAEYNVRVNAIAPGLTDTNMGFYKSEEELKKTISRSSMKRMGTPEEIAEAILFLASDQSSFMTGAILNVDGGRLA